MKSSFGKLSIMVLCVILFQISSGCSQNNNQQAKSVWFSPSSDPNRKVQAALVLIPTNATPDDVRKILGTNCVFHHYGGSDTIPAQWFMEYPVAGGTISGGFITNGTVAIQFDETNIKNDDYADFHYVYKKVFYMFFENATGTFKGTITNGP